MFVLVQNDPQCPPGIIAGLIAASGHPFLTVAAYRNAPFPDPSRATGVIVLGGEMGVHDNEEFPHLARVRSLIAETLRVGTPLLGICLGGQLLSQVAGGSVASPSPHGEQGICRVDLTGEGTRDPLFAGIDSCFVTFQLHNDSFTTPPGALLLASSPACPAQAFRLGSCAYGLQFHPEVDRAIVSCWGSLSHPPKEFLPEFLAEKASFDAASRTMLANFALLALASRRP